MKTKRPRSAKAKRFNRVHAVCTYLRQSPCELCPARVMTPYGLGIRGCYGLAQEVIDIARRGSPFPKATRAVIKGWRRRFNAP